MAGKKRTDNRGRILKDGESQRKDGIYRFRYTDADGVRRDIYSSRLVPTDRGDMTDLSLREKERKIIRDLEDGIKAQVENRASNRSEMGRLRYGCWHYQHQPQYGLSKI